MAEDKLSNREVEVLQLVDTGLSNKMISEKLFISIHTVKVHRKKINLKFGTHNTAGMLKEARRRGYILSSGNKNTNL